MRLTSYIMVIHHRPKWSLNLLQDQGWDIPELKEHSLKSKTDSILYFVSPSFHSLSLISLNQEHMSPPTHPVPHGIKLSPLAFITSSFSSDSQSIPFPCLLITSSLPPILSALMISSREREDTQTLWSKPNWFFRFFWPKYHNVRKTFIQNVTFFFLAPKFVRSFTAQFLHASGVQIKFSVIVYFKLFLRCFLENAQMW